MPVRSATRKQHAAACDTDRTWPLAYPNARSIWRICQRVMTTSRCAGLEGLRKSRTGFLSIHFHSRRAASNTEPSRFISRSTVPGFTFFSRVSRQTAKSSVPTSPIFLLIGRLCDSKAFKRRISHRSPRFVADSFSAYRCSALSKVCLEPAGVLEAALISVSRRAAHASASRFVGNTELSRVPRIEI